MDENEDMKSILDEIENEMKKNDDKNFSSFNYFDIEQNMKNTKFDDIDAIEYEGIIAINIASFKNENNYENFLDKYEDDITFYASEKEEFSYAFAIKKAKKENKKIIICENLS